MTAAIEAPDTAVPGKSPLSVPNIDVTNMIDPPMPASLILFPIAILNRHADLKLTLRAVSSCCTFVSKKGVNAPGKIPKILAFNSQKIITLMVAY